MFSAGISKILLAAVVVLTVSCITLGTRLYISNQKIDSLTSQVEGLNSEISSLNIKINGLNLLVKQNDEIASKTIETLNLTIKQCQQKQDDIISFCDKRVQLALESVEVDIAIEEAINQDGSSTLKGVDQKSSDSYIEELNKIIYGIAK